MHPPSPELLTVMNAFTGNGPVAFAIAALLAVVGIGLLWPRRIERHLSPTAPAHRSADEDDAGRRPSGGQWSRLSAVIATGASRTDEASRSHAAAGNTIEALEHDIWMLRDDLARLDHRQAEEQERPHRTARAAAIGIAA